MANEERFSGLAAEYSRFRPAYPDAAIDWLVRENGLSAQSLVADIGAGTGIFTGMLLQRGIPVAAVEPNADMAAVSAALHGSRPGFRPVNAPAEDTGLAAASVDLVTAAQAFHWFDPSLFQAECRRILKPGGRVAIVWNTRDPESPAVQQYYQLWAQHGGHRHARITLGEVDAEKAAFFAGGPPTVKLFSNNLVYNKEGFIGHALSASYMPKQGDARRLAVIKALDAFFEQWAVGETLIVPNYTEVFLGRVAG